MPQINQAGVELIQNFEGCRLRAYDDGTGVWTIGWGHTPATPGETVTQAQADQMLLDDLQRFEQGVNDRVSHSINPNQFAALVSLTYNVGLEGCPVMFQLVNGYEYELAQQHFSAYVYAGGQVLGGLVRRRAAEAALFGKPIE